VIRAVALAFALLVSAASAQAFTVGATLDPVTPNGFGFGVQFNARVLAFEVAEQPIDLLARIDATVPFSFAVSPSVNVGVTAITTFEGVRPYVGTGVGLLFSTIDGEPCWDIAWTIHAGVDVPVADSLAVRVDTQFAPTLGQFVVGVGVAYSFGQ
jgi:hypothetical protein